MRALHTRESAYRIIDDPWGDRLVPDAVREAIWQRALQDRPSTAPDAPRDAVVDAWLRASPAYASVITRSRHAEDALHAAVARGCTQYVMVGAGFDSYALRTPLPAAQLAIFEVDHPATQQLKRQCLAAIGQPAREAVTFIAADLATESLDAVLARSGFDATRPAFFSWLGVTMYLPREANLQALRAIARAGAAGSELVFTYVHQAVFESRAFTESAIATSVAAIGEPFLSGFHPAELVQDLHGVGLTLLEDLSDTQLVERYDPQGLNQLRTTPFSRAAHARVRGPAA